MKTLRTSLIAGGALWLASGCSLAPSDVSHVQISMPPGGLHSSTSSSASSLLNVPGMPYTSNTSNGFAMPQQISDFNCFGVVVIGPGIQPDQRLIQQCNPQLPNGAPAPMGIVAGFAPVSGGTIDVAIPSGPARQLKLFGIQSRQGCPAIDDILGLPGNNGSNAAGTPGTGNGGNGLGDPYLLAQATQDITADMSISLTASFVPGATPLFRCGNNGGGGGNGSSITLSGLDVFPHTASGSTQIRILGTSSGSGGSINVYSDAACTSAIPSQGWMYTGSSFYITATPTGSSPIYVQAQGQNGNSACSFAGNYLFTSGNSIGQIDSSMTGKLITASTAASMMVSGTCGSPGTTQVYANGTPIGSAATCSAGMFTAGSLNLTAIPDGLVKLGMNSTKTSPSTTQSDDAIYLWKDSLAPDLTVNPPGSNGLVTGLTAAAFTVSGSCSASGSPVNIYVNNGNTPNSAIFATTTCSAGSWSISLNLTAIPDGGVNLKLEHIGPNGPAHANNTWANLIKLATITEEYNLGSPFVSVANGVAIDSLNNKFVVGYGTSGAYKHWIVRKYSAGSWTTVLDYQNTSLDAVATGIVIDTADNIYVSGWDTAGTTHRWVVKKSADHGASWATVSPDIFFLAGGYPAEAHAITVDSSGNVYAAGIASQASGAPHWVVRKTINGGASWVTVDDYTQGPSYASIANAINVDPTSGNVVVGGQEQIVGGFERWVVRIYNGTWTQQTYLPYATGVSQKVNAVATDGAGNIFVAGSALDPGPANTHWLTLKLNGSTWTPLDDFTPPVAGTQTAVARAMVYRTGSLFVGGYVNNPTNGISSGWVVRQLYGGIWSTSMIPNAMAGTNGGVFGLYVNGMGVFSCGALLLNTQTDWMVKQETVFQ